MAQLKRKRNSNISNSGDQFNGLASPSSSPEPLTDDICPFQVKVLRNATNSPKRQKQEWTDVQTQELSGSSGIQSVSFIISPASTWQAMKKYKNFVVNDQTFGADSYIFVNNNGALTHDRSWIGRVLEIRAASPAEVYLRIFWMYWPDELPDGRQPYHGQNEVIDSNYMQIIDAMTVADRASVVHVIETDEAAPSAEGLYWRQKFDFLTNKLSSLRRDCLCKAYHNPDKLLISCAHCGKWQHETCIVQDTIRRHWEQQTLNARKERTGDDTVVDSVVKQEASDTIEVVGGKGLPLASRNTDRAISITQGQKDKKGKGKGKGKRRNSVRSAHVPEVWEGQLEGSLGRHMDAQGEETAEITGEITITEKGGGPTQHEAKCLFCHEPLLLEAKDGILLDEKPETSVVVATPAGST